MQSYAVLMLSAVAVSTPSPTRFGSIYCHASCIGVCLRASVLAAMAFPPHLFETAAAMHNTMEVATAGGRTVRNFCGTISAPVTPATCIIETPLFPVAALELYSALNLGEVDVADAGEYTAAVARWYSPERGGPQGDYAAGMPAKVANVIDALAQFPKSKRAVLTVPTRNASHKVDEDAKCLRELHFYVEDDGAVHATGFMRAQAASIFPKNSACGVRCVSRRRARRHAPK